MLTFLFTFLCLEQFKSSPRTANVCYTGIYMVKMLILQFFLEIGTTIFFKVILVLHLLACSHMWEFLRKFYFNKWIIALIVKICITLAKSQVKKILY